MKKLSIVALMLASSMAFAAVSVETANTVRIDEAYTSSVSKLRLITPTGVAIAADATAMTGIPLDTLIAPQTLPGAKIYIPTTKVTSNSGVIKGASYNVYLSQLVADSTTEWEWKPQTTWDLDDDTTTTSAEAPAVNVYTPIWVELTKASTPVKLVSQSLKEQVKYSPHMSESVPHLVAIPPAAENIATPATKLGTVLSFKSLSSGAERVWISYGIGLSKSDGTKFRAYLVTIPNEGTGKDQSFLVEATDNGKDKNKITWYTRTLSTDAGFGPGVTLVEQTTDTGTGKYFDIGTAGRAVWMTPLDKAAYKAYCGK